MKLSTALAVLIAMQRHSHRMMCVLASADDHERKLRINQDDAAKRVNDAVDLAMASVYAGDVHGVALPLNFVHLSRGPQQLTVALRLPGVDRDQHLFVDTGSSGLAFCDKSLAEEAVNITKTDYAQCQPYDNKKSCPNDLSVKGDYTFYVGQVFKGNIVAYNNNTGEEVASMNDVHFAIMSKVQDDVLCREPLDGIIGVAYKAANAVVVTPSPDFDALNLWEEFCERDDPLFPSIGKCNYSSFNATTLTPPLEQSLQGAIDSGYNSVEAFGLYCNYAATIGSERDTIVSSLGAYFGGDVALNNTFYNSGTPQVAAVGHCGGQNFTNYYLVLSSMKAPGLNFSRSGFDQCLKCGNYCYTDSGTSDIELPLPPSDCDYIKSLDVSDLKEMGSLLLNLAGVNGSTVTLSLPLLWLKERIVEGTVRCSTEKTRRFVLGFPIYQFYYLVYDMGNNTVTFVDLQLSNETQAFIDGPELGGAAKEPSTSSEPSTGYRHTGTRSTNTFVMAGLFMLACKYIF